MKPRLEVIPQTQEDWTIFCDFVERTRMPIIELSERSDRRDADLMFYAQQFPLVTWIDPDINVRNSVAAYWADPPWETL